MYQLSLDDGSNTYILTTVPNFRQKTYIFIHVLFTIVDLNPKGEDLVYFLFYLPPDECIIGITHCEENFVLMLGGYHTSLPPIIRLK